ncbi:hypothetical protein EDB83DRAFT_2315241 [Lactarius deliciosus]|nr:hypothetical protein EDB83DRAFT_2315241 [Lactarius deliciosus]
MVQYHIRIKAQSIRMYESQTRGSLGQSRHKLIWTHLVISPPNGVWGPSVGCLRVGLRRNRNTWPGFWILQDLQHLLQKEHFLVHLPTNDCADLNRDSHFLLDIGDDAKQSWEPSYTLCICNRSLGISNRNSKRATLPAPWSTAEWLDPCTPKPSLLWAFLEHHYPSNISEACGKLVAQWECISGDDTV